MCSLNANIYTHMHAHIPRELRRFRHFDLSSLYSVKKLENRHRWKLKCQCHSEEVIGEWSFRLLATGISSLDPWNRNNRWISICGIASQQELRPLPHPEQDGSKRHYSLLEPDSKVKEKYTHTRVLPQKAATTGKAPASWEEWTARGAKCGRDSPAVGRCWPRCPRVPSRLLAIGKRGSRLWEKNT